MIVSGGGHLDMLSFGNFEVWVFGYLEVSMGICSRSLATIWIRRMGAVCNVSLFP